MHKTHVLIASALVTSLLLHPSRVDAQAPSTDAAALSAAAKFHDLLARGDSAAVIGLLAPDLSVVEAGSVETRAEYLAHHLGADIEFAKAVPSTRTIVSTQQQGDVVWIVATSEGKGTYRDRAIETRGAELMVLAKVNGTWMIRSIHWSSRPRRPAGG